MASLYAAGMPLGVMRQTLMELDWSPMMGFSVWTLLRHQALCSGDALLQYLKGHTYQLAAAVSFAYNVGAGAYCGSTTAKRFNAGDWMGACHAMNEADNGRLQWVTADGRVLSGLVKRRAQERELCKRSGD